MIKNIFKTALVLAVVIGLNACNGVATPSKIQSIVKKGELVLGTSGNMTPMTRTIYSSTIVEHSDLNLSGTVLDAIDMSPIDHSNDKLKTITTKTAIGFDIDLAQSMADTMGVKLVIKVIPLDNLIDAVASGEVDIAISNLTITPSRNMKVAFVGPYLTSGKCIITQAPNLAHADAKKLNESHKKIAVTRGSTSEEFVKLAMPGITPISITTQEEAISLVREHKVAAFLTDYPVCKAIIANNPDDKFVSVFTSLTYDPIGIAIAQQNTHLQNWTQNFVARADKMGLLQALANKWFK